MLRGKMEKKINKGLNTDSKTQVSHCTAPSKPPDLCHLRVPSTSSHRALWFDTTSASGSHAAGCSPDQDTQHSSLLGPKLFIAPNSLDYQLNITGRDTYHCQQFSHHLSRPCPGSSTIPSASKCVLKGQIASPLLILFQSNLSHILTYSAEPTSTSSALHLSGLSESLKNKFRKSPVASHRDTFSLRNG